jgi:DNA polymerase III epsilon subunit-like protein
MNPIRIVIVDTETTGLDRQKDEPIEIAMLRYEWPSWEPCGVLYERLKTTFASVSPEAAKVNGYTPEEWMVPKAKLPSADIVDSLIGFTAGCHWVGSMPQFDFDILDLMRRRYYPSSIWALASHRLIDVGSLGAPLMFAGLTEKGGLDAICKVLQIEVGDLLHGGAFVNERHPLYRVSDGRIGAHTALGDALRTARAFERLMNRYVSAWDPSRDMVTP